VAQAREIAYRLLLFAQEIENGRPIGFHRAGSSGQTDPGSRPES
jgi:hypothetical protein